MNYTKGECGCKVVSGFLVGNVIEYCPLHIAAPKMVETLEEIDNTVAYLEGTQLGDTQEYCVREIKRIVREALSKEADDDKTNQLRGGIDDENIKGT